MLQAKAYRAYREVLADAAVETARELGWQIDSETARFLPDSLPAWIPFDETNRALERLAARGLSLGILSNIDDELLESTCRHFTVEFDVVVTAEQVRSYKPAHGHFRRAAAAIGKRRWLHVAQSYFHDIEPAYELGIPSVWVNRKAERPTGKARPDWEVTDLLGLVDLIVM
jgi:2-haloacid dehalogenase/putative hydrolase of the HAD superfamily